MNENGLWKCVNCGTENEFEFCTKCGTAKVVEKFCTKCGNKVKKEHVYCGKCGNKINW